MKKCIILANGRPPEKAAVKFLYEKGYNYLICADGGADAALKLKLNPNVIIGDFDSVLPDTIKRFMDSAEIIQIKRQSDTDVEKALKFAIKNGFEQAVLLGATGDRLDHSFCNLGIVFKYFGKIEIILVSEQSVLTAHEKSVEINSFSGETISFYGVAENTKVTTKGFKYKLADANIFFGGRESTSNITTGKKARLEIKGGKIILIRNFTALKEHDLF